jgi:hypothetical protein
MKNVYENFSPNNNVNNYLSDIKSRLNNEIKDLIKSGK